jgi:hypothetical protein
LFNRNVKNNKQDEVIIKGHLQKVLHLKTITNDFLFGKLGEFSYACKIANPIIP